MALDLPCYLLVLGCFIFLSKHLQYKVPIDQSDGKQTVNLNRASFLGMRVEYFWSKNKLHQAAYKHPKQPTPCLTNHTMCCNMYLSVVTLSHSTGGY